MAIGAHSGRGSLGLDIRTAYCLKEFRRSLRAREITFVTDETLSPLEELNNFSSWPPYHREKFYVLRIIDLQAYLLAGLLLNTK